MTTLLIEPFGGLAGDMFLAGLLDLGDPRFELRQLEQLAEALVPGECRLVATEVQRGGLRGTRLEVVTPESAEAPHRHLAELVALLEGAALPPAVFARARAVLERIAVAEGRVHGIDKHAVHFHEVGAVDTLIDVAGAALALELLGVTRVFSTPPLAGEGTLHCAHGELPVPAPGTAEIARGMPLVLGGGPGERLTPTGAALLAEFVDAFELPGVFRAERLGTGAGTRDPQQGPANLCRIQLGESLQSSPAGTATASATVTLLEFNLDDTTGEEIGFCVGELRAAGALEVWTAAVQMKQDRPGVIVSALVRPGGERALERVAFEHTPTLGVRRSTWQRTECERDSFEVELAGEVVRIKRRLRPGSTGALGPADLSPEYQDLARVARATGRSLRELEREAVGLALRHVSGSGAHAEG